MANESRPLLTQTKTRTKVLLGLALAVIIGGIIAAAGGISTNKKICDSGPKKGKRCIRDSQCKFPISPGAKCVSLYPPPPPEPVVQHCSTGPQLGAPCSGPEAITSCAQPCTSQGYCSQGICGGTLPAEPTITLVAINGISSSGTGFWTDLSFGEDGQSGWPQWTPAIPTPEVSVGQQVTGVLSIHMGTSTPSGGGAGFTVPLWSKVTTGPTGIVIRDWTQHGQPGFSSINFTVTQEMLQTDVPAGEQPYVPLAVWLRNDNGTYRLAQYGEEADDLVKVQLRVAPVSSGQ